VRLCLEWCERNEHPVELTRAQIQQYAAELIAAGKEASTVRLRLAALRQFARWLVSEGELPEDQLLGIKPPKIPTKPVNGLSDEQLRAVLKACKGSSFGIARRGGRAADGRNRPAGSRDCVIKRG
jgi:integrase/recombinase XerD